MFSAVSWNNYIRAVIILVAFWYLVIAFVYYRKEIFNLFSGKYKILPLKQKVTADTDTNGQETETAYSFEELEGIVTDIRHSILEEAGKGADKEALLTQLKSRLANYGGLRQPAFRVAINNFLIQHAESICGVAFSEVELDEAWEALPR